MASNSDSSFSASPLTQTGKILILTTAFLGWLFAGLIMVIIPLAGRSAAQSLLGWESVNILSSEQEGEVGRWFARYVCAFLLGAAAGGALFGWLGDRIGRVRAMGLSILCYSCVTGLSYFVQTPDQLLILRFIACFGVGGMWPNGVALASEAWPNVSRPWLAGLIGTSANLGFVLLGIISSYYPITASNWRWVMIVGALPAGLACLVFLAVPESPMWLRGTKTPRASAEATPLATVFRPPFLKLTMLGILLGTIPLLGNWGGANWLVPWAGKVGAEVENPVLKSQTQITRSTGAAIGALVGGWLANRFGRRTTYFLISLGSLVSTAYCFWLLTPLDPSFLTWVFILGFFGTVYFGWLPLYLPELFPTRVRASGTGVSFNFGRIFSALGVLGAGAIIHHFQGDYSKVGQVTSLVYILGMVIICFAPDTSKSKLDE